MPLTTVDGAMLNTANAQYTMFKNRLINGAMIINQRVFTSSTTATTYPYDQWTYEKNASTGTFTCSTSTDAPPGFTNSIQLTTTTGMSSVGAAEFVQIGNYIEGFNIYDFQWGGSSAVPVVLSFWFKASQTGTYAASIANTDGSYVFAGTFTVISSGVWEYKTISITGALAGTWNTNNSIGIGLRIGLAYGSTYTTGVTNNAWKAGSGFAGLLPTTTNNSATTTGAYVKLAGVQLEKGLNATSFDYRPYATELVLCQRYFQKSYDQATAPGTVTRVGCVQIGTYSNSATGQNNSVGFRFMTAMRAGPAMVGYDPDTANTINVGRWDAPSTAATQGAISFGGIGDAGIASVGIATTGRTVGAALTILFHYTANAQLV
jgi:hypothetical protein